MLRITEGMGRITQARDLAHVRAELDARQREASSGKRIEKPSDDPSGASRLVRLDDELSTVDACSANRSLAIGQLQASDTALGSMSDLLVRARELAVAMSNDSCTATERAAAAEEVRGLRAQVITLANTQAEGVYLFGGTRTDQPPVDESTGTVTGDANTRQLAAAPGLTASASVSAVEALAPTSGQDVLGLLDDLAQDLDTNDAASIRGSLDALGASQAQIVEARARVGVMSGRLQDLDTVASAQKASLEESRSSIADADSVESFSELARAQQALEATLTVTARLLSSLTLVDKV
jgi:flagellar hook-associated protein 3 FlgL